jgi:2-polyprenyl-3-methyl-5-hydroxy-6-metoxy-1,4-benzoquinol methylase
MRGTLNPTTGAEGGQGRVLDAVAAYDRIAPGYRELSERRRAYLDAVDAEILRRVPRGAGSLIDVGAGDGRRAVAIAERAGVSRVVLVEPSAGMRGLIAQGVEVWNQRVEAMADPGARFDVVLCLWNVLGHVPGELRVAALRNLGSLCSAGGLIVLDVIHGYNVAECGLGVVLRRLLSSRSGDVPVKWRTAAGDVETVGHVFTAGEMEGLFREAGLDVVERIVLNYETGRRESWAALGNLLYVLRGRSFKRASRTTGCGRRSTN